MEHSGKLQTIDELDPSHNLINDKGLAKFLSDFDHTYMDRARPIGPDYFIIDDFASLAGLDNSDLLAAKT